MRMHRLFEALIVDDEVKAADPGPSTNRSAPPNLGS
jgi:hypothetical protein